MNSNEIIDGEDIAMDYRDHLASLGSRLGNLIIDQLAFWIICYALSSVLAILEMDELLVLIFGDGIGSYVILYSLYVLYYFSFEFWLGITPGKFLTKTRVVSIKGAPLTAGQVFGRSLARLVPLEPLSFLAGRMGWHDTWSNTAVVDRDFTAPFATKETPAEV